MIQKTNDLLDYVRNGYKSTNQQVLDSAESVLSLCTLNLLESNIVIPKEMINHVHLIVSYSDNSAKYDNHNDAFCGFDIKQEQSVEETVEEILGDTSDD